MKRFLFLVATALTISAGAQPTPTTTAPTPTPTATAAVTTVEATTASAPNSGTATVSVYFSPNGGAQAAIIREIDAATQWIRLQAYSYTSAPISEALVKAHKRGVKIKAILDRSNATAQYSGATFLQNAGIPVLIDAKHAIAHSKIMILDGGTPNATIITGSFNFTKAAEEKNAENLLILKNCPELVNAYGANFRTHEAHSKPYTRRTQ